ncbi:hypothetical protein Sru01_31400 [Sphaerisporangium rufum]|uniref:N-acetyltransferase domain-containing protein n=1 Tax=Sphaerisporangium rufum TaxID=1381558 RepID=A0A919R333_9ACTN|nr:GNAT family N-acetyltransferase [Sphaerisporangium rufum]GII78158.1 hypothetical protein Sru01_31400 [Sphaerisporangium rufum]
MLPRSPIPAGPAVLRPHEPGDAESMVLACADPEIVRHVPLVPAPYTAGDARAFLAELAPAVWERGGAAFAVADAGTGTWLGNLDLKPVDPFGCAELGYLLAPWARGRGVMSGALRALAPWAFGHGVRRLEITAGVENLPSQRAAMAAGFHPEGVRRGAIPRRDGGRDDLAAYARLPGDTGERVRSYLPGLPDGRLTDGVAALTPLGPGDAGAFQKMMTDPETVRYSVPPVPPDPADTETRCRHAGMWWLRGERAEMAVRDATTGEFAGHLQVMNVVPPIGQAMIGYSLLPGFRGRGLMTRAVNLLCEWAFTATALHRLVAGTDPANVASHRVLERAGFSREAVIRELLPAADGTRHDDQQWVRLRR